MLGRRLPFPGGSLDRYDEMDLGLFGRIEFAQSLWFGPPTSIFRLQSVVDVIIQPDEVVAAILTSYVRHNQQGYRVLQLHSGAPKRIASQVSYNAGYSPLLQL